MHSYLKFENVWFHNDLIELKITVCDGLNTFQTSVYSNYQVIEANSKKLDQFKALTDGGSTEVEFGGFGQEVEYGGFFSRMKVVPKERCQLLIFAKMETDHFDFGGETVASKAELYLITDAAHLNDFVENLKSIGQHQGNTSMLLCHNQWVEGVCD